MDVVLCTLNRNYETFKVNSQHCMRKDNAMRGRYIRHKKRKNDRAECKWVCVCVVLITIIIKMFMYKNTAMRQQFNIDIHIGIGREYNLFKVRHT